MCGLYWITWSRNVDLTRCCVRCSVLVCVWVSVLPRLLRSNVSRPCAVLAQTACNVLEHFVLFSSWPRWSVLSRSPRGTCRPLTFDLPAYQPKQKHVLTVNSFSRSHSPTQKSSLLPFATLFISLSLSALWFSSPLSLFCFQSIHLCPHTYFPASVSLSTSHLSSFIS